MRVNKAFSIRGELAWYALSVHVLKTRESVHICTFTCNIPLSNSILWHITSPVMQREYTLRVWNDMEWKDGFGLFIGCRAHILLVAGDDI